MRSLLVLSLLVVMGSVALAGPNAGGVILVHNASITQDGDMCGRGTAPDSCRTANTRLDSEDVTPWVWKIYAAFPSCSAPRLKAMSLGITYSDYFQEGTVIMLGQGSCLGEVHDGAAEFPSNGWPRSGGGDVLVWAHTQTSKLVEMYWFAGYSYPYGSPSSFVLGPNPDPSIGAVFADDAQPPALDPIAGFGVLGFNQPGSVPCPAPGRPGVCCQGAECRIVCEDDCVGRWMGSEATCDPGTCVQIPKGACCTEVDCYQWTAAECDRHCGRWYGDGSYCSDMCTDMPPEGACCFGEACVVMSQFCCERQGGTYHGHGVRCTEGLCAGTPVRESTWGRIKSRFR